MAWFHDVPASAAQVRFWAVSFGIALSAAASFRRDGVMEGLFASWKYSLVYTSGGPDDELAEMDLVISFSGDSRLFRTSAISTLWIVLDIG